MASLRAYNLTMQTLEDSDDPGRVFVERFKFALW